MKILFVISDLWENSVDRQLAEIIQELLEGEAESEILETLDGAESTAETVKRADAVWFILRGDKSAPLRAAMEFVDTMKFFLDGKYCALASIGGKEGGKRVLKKFYDKMIGTNMKIMDDEVTCVPLKTDAFECAPSVRADLYWQKESFLKFCNSTYPSKDRKDAVGRVAKNYFTIMKCLSKDRRKPAQLKINYPDILTDVGSFDLSRLPNRLKELHYEIDALTSDFQIGEEETESALRELIEKEWETK